MLSSLTSAAAGLLLRRCQRLPPLPLAAPPLSAADPAAAVRARWASGSTIDRSRFPRLEEQELEERFVRGSGPGGQSVNKTANCVSLKHLPTGLVVKCHESRSLETNRRLAREQLLTKLDQLLNGDGSVAAQEARRRAQKQQRRDDQRRRRLDRKQQWRAQREAEAAGRTETPGNGRSDDGS